MPTLNVASAATDRRLVSLSAIKAELGITGSTFDAKFQAWLLAASDVVSAACGIAEDQRGRRTLISEGVSIGYRPDEISCGWELKPLILPWRIPAVITAVTVDGIALDVDTEIEVNPMDGLLYRLDSSGCRAVWDRVRTIIAGTAGWVQADVPEAARQAVIRYCRERYDGDGRNSLLKAEETDGVGRDEYWIGPTSKGEALPADVMDALRAAGLVKMAVCC